MINLPDVTLVAVDSVACRLTRLALEDTLAIVAPAATLVFSDNGEARPFGANWIVTKRLRSLDEADDVLWHDVLRHVATSHIMVIQWDGWAINEGSWTDEFLHYDYVGAPWPWHDHNQVGNGGFSLRSIALMRAVSLLCPPKPRGRPEDEMICRDYRTILEHRGYRWAPPKLAKRFSVEHGEIDHGPFGFHDVRNWPRVLTRDDVATRVAMSNNYVRAKTGFREVEDQLV